MVYFIDEKFSRKLGIVKCWQIECALLTLLLILMILEWMLIYFTWQSLTTKTVLLQIFSLIVHGTVVAFSNFSNTLFLEIYLLAFHFIVPLVICLLKRLKNISGYCGNYFTDDIIKLCVIIAFLSYFHMISKVNVSFRKTVTNKIIKHSMSQVFRISFNSNKLIPHLQHGLCTYTLTFCGLK